MSKKNKPAPCTVLSREALEATVADVVANKLEYAGTLALMELEISQVQKRHQASLLAIAEKIQSQEAGIYVYCQGHRTELFPGKAKSLDLLLATIGFRTDPPSVEKISKKDTWESIAKRLQSVDWGAAYIREPSPEVDKQALLKDRLTLTPAQLQVAGVRFDQDEQFFIEPKSEVAQASTQEAA